ncbi:uncharacterized protein NPIL_564251 [Nephila pilipes]|uniref:Uncharacterized protein n=1 Tax=Nephila pilipes TaxID=299642 RepID=A0A8X6PQX5_NEPPI|nr:uncharacterized protein NPIL_564251 [Nephila pilipes]
MNISPIKNISDIHGLHNLCDEYETQIRSLEALGVTEKSYSCLLFPILLKVLPCELTLEFTRIEDNGEKWDVQILINFLRDETESRERAFQLHRSELKLVEIKPRRDVRTYGRNRFDDKYRRNIKTSCSSAPLSDQT